MSRRLGVLLTAAVILVLPYSPTAEAEEDRPRKPTRVDFVKRIQPLLKKHCYSCHGNDLQEGGLRLDRKSDAFAGGDNGKVIEPGKAAKSILLGLISGTDPQGRRMPPAEEAPPLKKEQILLIRKWIEAGAEWPDQADEVKAKTPLWSLKPVRRRNPPAVAAVDWVRNPIDQFLLARLEKAGMTPSGRATPRALIRRATLDLIGLPPTPAEVDAFLADLARGSADLAWSRLIDRLLASPHHGERWGRHWLDLVRYADSNGYEVDGEKPMAWKYRDYVIRAFNADISYRRFVLEQLAGDELPDADTNTVLATGFYRVGPWDAERGASVQPSEVIEERFNELDDLVSTTSQVFLGLTMGCARCHDHKFDPLTTREYYQMVAIFNPLTRHKNGRTELTRPAVPPRQLERKRNADERAARLRQLVAKLSAPLSKAILETGATKLSADAVAALRVPPDKRSDGQKQTAKRFAKALEKEVSAALEKESARKFLDDETLEKIRDARRAIVELESRFQQFPQGYFLFEGSPKPAVTHLLKRGNPKQPGEVVEPGVPLAVAKRPPVFRKPDAFTSRRRLSLAEWIVDEQNPLTARVAVNRVWQHHFGVGLVRTPSDFGHRGEAPTHPELLDWLAHWFAHDADYSLKRLHRLIMTSNAYRMSKKRIVSYAAKDPDNRLLWRFPYRRLEVEAIRDSILAVGGRLDASLFGPGMYPFIPEDARRSGYNPKKVWPAHDERRASRRTIYAYVKRTLVVPFLDTLDFCDTTRSAPRRDITTVAPQALELLNGEFVNRQAERFADRLIRAADNDPGERLDLAYRLALARPPRPDELEALREFMSGLQAKWRKADPAAVDLERRALVQVCRVIFNLNEFVYPD